MEFCINANELRRALGEIEAAEKHGFNFCLAVFKMTSAGFMLSECRASYSDLIERAHPSDGKFDWGRFQGVSRRHFFENGALVPLPVKSANNACTRPVVGSGKKAKSTPKRKTVKSVGKRPATGG